MASSTYRRRGPHRLDLYDLCLAVRDAITRGDRGALRHVHPYAQRHGIGLSTVYFRIEQLAHAIQRHPWFNEIRPLPPPPPQRVIFMVA